MKNMYMLLSLLFIVGFVPASAQSFDSVVINEVDTNPSGDDAESISEWVEIYNPTDSFIDIGGWQIASTVLKKTMIIPFGTSIDSGQFLAYSYQRSWFVDSNESVELRNRDGLVIDKTPLISDVENDFTSWQRIYDGFDHDGVDDWKFAPSTIGSSNGRLIEPVEIEKITITLDSQDPSYLFGQTAILHGSVSQRVITEKPIFKPESVSLNISGPNYNDILTLYPDSDLNYKATITLHKVLGINEGTYNVTASYAGATASTSFNVGFEIIEPVESRVHTLEILTDKSQYTPGESVIITGFASDVVPFEGMIFTILDASDTVLSQGTLFPTNGEFKTNFYIDNINPNFGQYTITAQYNDKSISSTFQIVQDIKEDILISLSTDKPAYALGQTVEITGRLNDIWVPTLDIEIEQITHSFDGPPFKTSNSLQVKGDGSFDHKFEIPNNMARYGDYKITVSQDVGFKDIIISVLKDPSSFLISDDPITIQTDKQIYDFGDDLIVSGFVKDPSSYLAAYPVKITISNEDGSPLEIAGLDNLPLNPDGTLAGYDFTAILESSGIYSVSIHVTQNIFSDGNYIIKAKYDDAVAMTSFSISNPDGIMLDDPVSQDMIVSSEKPFYKPGDQLHVLGHVTLTDQEGARLVIPPRVTVMVLDAEPPYRQIHESKLYPDQNGQFSGLFELPSTVFSAGTYTVKANYESQSAKSTFNVAPDPADSDAQLELATDKTTYYPGDSVTVTGKTSKLVYLEKFDIALIQESLESFNCDSFCGDQIGATIQVLPNQSGSFTHELMIPDSDFSIGPYGITVDAGFDTQTIQFDVIKRPKLDTIIEKENGISEKSFPLTIKQKTIDSGTIAPRVVSGSLITPDRDDSDDVNIRISTDTGVCIIGPDDCLVSQSTRKPGQIYDTVTVDDMSLNVRYSGPDVRLEKFSILPESSTEFLPDTNWNVDIVKNDQQSRFYYKITYKSLE